jgi:hypothetical protein
MTGFHGDTLFAGEDAWAAGMIADRKLPLLATELVRNWAAIDLRQDLLLNGLRHLLPHRVRIHLGHQSYASFAAAHPGLPEELLSLAFEQLQARLAADRAKRPAFGPDQWHRYLSLTTNLYDEALSAFRFNYYRHGLELLMPYQDRRLFEFVMAVPAYQLGRPGRDRWLMRNALAGMLPNNVLERKTYTIFVELLEKGLQVQEKDQVRELLLHNPYVVEHNYVREEWLRQQLARQISWTQDKHAFFLWKILSLELWLKHILP